MPLFKYYVSAAKKSKVKVQSRTSIFELIQYELKYSGYIEKPNHMLVLLQCLIITRPYDTALVAIGCQNLAYFNNLADVLISKLTKGSFQFVQQKCPHYSTD